MLTNEEYNEIYEGIFVGAITLTNLPVNMYQNTASQLQKSVYKGYGRNLNSVEVAGKEWLLLNDFRENVNVFSSAKTFQNIKDFQSIILDPQGKIIPFNQYLENARKVTDIYDNRWMKVERNTAISQAQSARQWGQIEEDAELFPWLIYHTQKDERVRASHAALDGFTAPVNDSYWSSIMVPNDFGCRCWVEQSQEGKRSSKQWEIDRVKEFNKEVKPEDKIKSIRDIPGGTFKMNSAKDRIIFKTEGIGSHPYMKVGEAFEVNKMNNFGMDINFGL